MISRDQIEQILKKHKMYFQSCDEVWFSDDPSLEFKRKTHDYIIKNSEKWIFLKHENLYGWMLGNFEKEVKKQVGLNLKYPERIERKDRVK